MTFRRLVTAAGIVATASAGCAITAPVAGGPLRPNTTTQVQPSWAIAYGSASVNAGGKDVSGNGQTFGEPLELGAVAPVRLGLRQALGSAAEMSADVGWLDSGLELRTGSLGGGEVLPWAISAGVRSAKLALNRGEQTYDGRLRFEVYPSASRDGAGQVHWLLSAGVSGGAFQHALSVPRVEGGDVPSFDPSITVVRPEVRLELAIGINVSGAHGGVTVAIAPWFLLHADAPTKVTCRACGLSPDVTAFSQSWGVALILTPTLAADPIAFFLGPR